MQARKKAAVMWLAALVRDMFSDEQRRWHVSESGKPMPGCVDCKVLARSSAERYWAKYGAAFAVLVLALAVLAGCSSGDVVTQGGDAGACSPSQCDAIETAIADHGGTAGTCAHPVGEFIQPCEELSKCLACCGPLCEVPGADAGTDAMGPGCDTGDAADAAEELACTRFVPLPDAGCASISAAQCRPTADGCCCP